MTQSPRGRYICLSHRWGNQRLLTTTRETLQARLEGIPLTGLSQTFRDSVSLARKLGVRYLWIDCLCIIQDSDENEDWEIESAKMGSYYKNSWLTIGAGLPGVSGLFAERTCNEIYCRLQIQDDLGPSTLYFTSNPLQNPKREDQNPEKVDSIGMKSSTLDSRAWTLQEEALSPRFLSFEPTQVYFRCGPHVELECGLRGFTAALRNPLAQNLLKPEDWTNIVKGYASRQLTIETDKLPALSGLARSYRENRRNDKSSSPLEGDDVYLAGLWLQNLPYDLLWGRVSNDTRFGRPKSYRAPSWSWAAIDASITLYSGEYPSRYDLPEITATVGLVHILSASTKLLGRDAFGQVSGGEITLQGQLFQGRRWAVPTSDLGQAHEVRFYFCERDRSRFANGYSPTLGSVPLLWPLQLRILGEAKLIMDDNGTPVEDHTIWFLPILKWKFSSRHVGLALVQADNNTKYKRVGIIEVEEMERVILKAESQTQTITLI
jgi:hypothetical protein